MKSASDADWHQKHPSDEFRWKQLHEINPHLSALQVRGRAHPQQLAAQARVDSRFASRPGPCPDIETCLRLVVRSRRRQPRTPYGPSGGTHLPVERDHFRQMPHKTQWGMAGGLAMDVPERYSEVQNGKRQVCSSCM